MEQECILVIEDDPATRNMLVDVLRTVGDYAVTAIDSAFDAAELVRELQPSAVLLDLGPPFRAGTDLLAELKSDPRTANVPIVVVSGLPESLTPEQRATAWAVLAKPLRIEQLLAVLLRLRLNG